MNKMGSKQATTQFLEEVFKGNGERLIGIWNDGNKKVRCFKNIKNATNYAHKLNRRNGVFVNVGTFKTPPASGRGRAEDISAIRAFCIDLDFAKEGKHGPKTKSEAESFLLGLPIPPTMIIFSGHGVHAWYQFPKFLDFSTSDDRQVAAQTGKCLECLVREEARKLGWHTVDPVSDLARVMRLVGTVNRKSFPIVSHFISKGGPKYTIGQIQSAIDDFTLKNAFAGPNGIAFKRLWDGDKSAYENDDSRADYALCRLLLRLYQKDARAVDRQFRKSRLFRDKWDEVHTGDKCTYGERTIEKAMLTIDDVAENNQSQSDQLVNQLVDAELFHTPEKEPFATVSTAHGELTLKIRSSAFEDYLNENYLKETRRVASKGALNDAISTLSGKARFTGPETSVHIRIASHEGSLYLDLGTGEKAYVKISKMGWKLISTPPVKFFRPNGFHAMPQPVRGGRWDELRSLINIGSNQNWVLYSGWLAQCFRPKGPFPILVLIGEQGSAKSTTSRVSCKLVDPKISALLSAPNSMQDLAIMASNVWLLAFDNLSYINSWLSDALCKISTGTAFSTREFYTNNGLNTLCACNPVMINGIDELTGRGDLMDRCVFLQLPQLPDSKRITERNFWDKFNALYPSLLGALLDAVSEGLKRYDSVQLEEPPRMADFATWGTAVETGFGFKSGAFIAAYRSNRDRADSMAVEASPIGNSLLQFITAHSKDTWKGTANELLQELERTNFNSSRRPGWPNSARGLAGILRRLSPNLRRIGLDISWLRGSDRMRSRLISIKFVKSQPKQSETSAKKESGRNGRSGLFTRSKVIVRTKGGVK